MKTNLKTTMMDSISEVIETMFYLSVDFKDDATLEESGLTDADKTYISKLDFYGSFSGQLYILVPEDLLTSMTENFMGEDRSNLTNAHLEGIVKEIANMVAGNIFSKLDTNNEFELGIPVRLKLSEVPQEVMDKDKDDFIIVETSDGCFSVKIYVTQ